MISLFFSAFALGLVFNASPGAVFTESMRRGMHGGYFPAFHVQIGSLVGDATWAIFGLAGAGILFQMPAVRTPLTLLGAGYLAYLGVQTCLTRYQSTESTSKLMKGLSGKGDFTSGALLSLTNPANVFYWGALGGVLGALGIAQPEPLHYMIFFGGFMASSLIWCFVCAGIIHMLHRAMSHGMARLMNIVCGMALLYLSIATIRAME